MRITAEIFESESLLVDFDGNYVLGNNSPLDGII
jgi:hypothetical protein